MRVLLVEDDLPLGRSMKQAFVSAGYVVDWATDGDEAVAGARSQEYAAILLDLGLPILSGIDALKTLRGHRNTAPVLIISANDRLEQKIEGLDAGADDYLVKPFDLEELLARVRAHIRRHDGRTSNILVAGDLQLELDARRAAKNNEPLILTAKEFKVLALLMRRAGRFVSKSDLENAIYDDAVEVDSNTIEVTIYNLRRKVGSTAIMTVRGLGYMVPK
jgi:two-component system OmpR family response regulator/two-component system response regulator QseB